MLSERKKYIFLFVVLSGRGRSLAFVCKLEGAQSQQKERDQKDNTRTSGHKYRHLEYRAKTYYLNIL